MSDLRIPERRMDLDDYAKSDNMATLLSTKEVLDNKVTTINSESTDAQYPSAKCVYNMIGDVETILAEINGN